MSVKVRRVAAIAVILVLTSTIIAGCTLAGANAAPLTPVSQDTEPTQESGGQTEPLETDVVITPTQLLPIDLFGTQTAMAPTATEEPVETEIPTEVPTEEPTPVETEAPTEQPTAEPTAEPTEEPTAEPGDAECPATHTVQSGENLFRIALRYGLTTEALANANGITNPDAIAVGMVLNIPGCGPTGDGETDTSSDILHTVQEGENLYRIALQYGMTWQAVASYNGIADPNALSIGQVIRIPQQ